ncbi:hypothetical protein [Brevibacterium otitidis]|uniref:Phage gp6-like head-tail connector protein n=1 Tax=Brevibacterium otitidis TaxID=53364 RepID=A0ABV5WZQ6_9MICO|nr:hypothetical protein GCM10023233_25930 [Brevibacterium otitidis]
MITADRLLTHVNASAGEHAFAAECVDQAAALVDARVRDYPVPEAVADRARLEVAADLFYRRTARNGITSFDQADGPASTVRINRDPMAAANPILRPYLPPAIG